jgi:hypothetical protein
VSILAGAGFAARFAARPIASLRVRMSQSRFDCAGSGAQCLA